MSEPKAHFKTSDPVTKRTTEVTITFTGNSADMNNYHYQRVSYAQSFTERCIELQFTFQCPTSNRSDVLECARKEIALIHDLMTS